MYKDIEPEGRIRGVLWAGWIVVICLMFTAFFFSVMEKITWDLFLTMYLLPYVVWAAATIIAYIAQFKMRMVVGGSRKEKEEDWQRGGKKKYRYSGGGQVGRWDQGRVWDLKKGDWVDKSDDY